MRLLANNSLTRKAIAMAGSLLTAALALTAVPALAQLPGTDEATPTAAYYCVRQGTNERIGCFESDEQCEAGQTGGAGSGNFCDCVVDPNACAITTPPPTTGTPTTPPPPKLTNPIGTVDIPTLVARFTNIFLGLSGSLALFMFVWGGFLMVTAYGDDKKYAAGKKSIYWAVVGLLVIFTSYAVLDFIFASLGAASG